jgi:carboxymethylenebutenolidase
MGEATPPSAPLSFPEPQIISSDITLQAPLSRRGKGPGLVLVVNHTALIDKSENHLDPPPLQKWAEEGFAVVQLKVPGKVNEGGEFPLKRALELLKSCDACEYEKGVGLICKS